MKTFLIIGAGLSGCTVARTLADAGHTVHIVEKRPHLGGNVFDYVNEHGHRIHKYGPHIFHTSNMEVVDFLSRFTEWVPYEHRVKALLEDGQLVTLPVNKETKAIVGEENVIETFFRPYTEKMWGMKLEDVAPSVLKRVPVRDDMNELYFPDDTFQAMPKYGYISMINEMLNHANISCDYDSDLSKSNTLSRLTLSLLTKADHVFNSMPIDEYFEYEHGKLAYRSLRFHTQSVPIGQAFPVANVNFTDREPYTRVTEWKNFPNSYGDSKFTTLTWEEPCNDFDNNNERFYPVKDVDGKNRELYNEYRKMVDTDRMTFIGRLGMYVYTNMDMAVNSSKRITERHLAKSK